MAVTPDSSEVGSGRVGVGSGSGQVGSGGGQVGSGSGSGQVDSGSGSGQVDSGSGSGQVDSGSGGGQVGSGGGQVGSDGAGGEVGRRPGRPRAPGYDKAILDATLEILFDKGYAGVTIEGVAARSGVGRPTIYRRWPSKPALVIAAISQSVGVSPTPDTGSLRQDLLAFQRQQARLMDWPASRRITAGLVADLVADPELAEPYFRDYLEPRRVSVWEALQRGVDRGELHPDTDFSLIYDMLLGPLFVRSVVRGEPLGPDLAEQTVNAVLAAFGRGSKAGRSHR